MTDIYDTFDRATRHIEAYALLLDGKAVGRIVIKHGNAATAFVQIWQAEMAMGRATGYGYDKATAAVAEAVSKLPTQAEAIYARGLSEIRDAFADGDRGGTRWPSRLEEQGFTVCNVIA